MERDAAGAAECRSDVGVCAQGPKNAVPGPKEPGTRALIAAQYSQNSPKNNGHNRILSAHFGVKANGPKGHIGPIPQCHSAMTGGIPDMGRAAQPISQTVSCSLG